MINGFFVAVLAFVIVAGPVMWKRAREYDRLSLELERLDDESLAEAWERGER